MKVLTFGEIMLRLQPFGFKRLSQADSFEACFSGGEANVAVSIARFGEEAVFLSKLPANEIADHCIAALRGEGVTPYIVRGGERMGIYFIEKGASQRASKVVYDRKYASVNTLTPDEIDFDRLFDGVDWFHFTGITAAISEGAYRTLSVVAEEAKRRGVTVSCDLNYRKNLWTSEQAGIQMRRLMPFVDVLISNEEDCKQVFGLEGKGSDIEGGVLNADGYADIAAKIRKEFPSISSVAFTLRESLSASANNWSGVLFRDGKGYFSKKYAITHIVDRVGGGDSFAGGLIYALASGKEPQDAIEFAVAASCLKHSIEGDWNAVSVKEVESLVKNGGSGRVAR